MSRLFCAPVQRLCKLLLGEGQHLGGLEVQFLPLQDPNELQLLFKGCEKLRFLLSQLLVVGFEGSESAPDLLA